MWQVLNAIISKKSMSVMGYVSICVFGKKMNIQVQEKQFILKDLYLLRNYI